jgi:hypothetical protein
MSSKILSPWKSVGVRCGMNDEIMYCRYQVDGNFFRSCRIDRLLFMYTVNTTLGLPNTNNLYANDSWHLFLDKAKARADSIMMDAGYTLSESEIDWQKWQLLG